MAGTYALIFVPLLEKHLRVLVYDPDIHALMEQPFPVDNSPFLSPTLINGFLVEDFEKLLMIKSFCGASVVEVGGATAIPAGWRFAEPWNPPELFLTSSCDFNATLPCVEILQG
eukprot:CAMPEP_0114507922 /NCGR_PEP_ID=MMETSP0109-20121206/12296_1 /TAXON_ID=29199 /ORGANISM="Chlorarachnion reptans, Strain CCCM449" /LENGTH=113 /DNA_ID=CAMNT_0001686763 /DNA_START=409 /DNA_END=748 /DNA_ORIENTATION=-